MSFAENLKRCRRAAGLTQKQLADKTNVSQVSILYWETGRFLPTKNNALQLARVLGVSYNDLMKGEETNGRIRNNESHQA